jgi:hypothetical protein
MWGFRLAFKHPIAYRYSIMGDIDDSRPPLEVIVGRIPAVEKGRYMGLSAWIMFLWDHGEPTSRIFNRMTVSMLRSSGFI